MSITLNECELYIVMVFVQKERQLAIMIRRKKENKLSQEVR